MEPQNLEMDSVEEKIMTALLVLSASTMLAVAVVIVVYASGLCRGKKGVL